MRRSEWYFMASVAVAIAALFFSPKILPHPGYSPASLRPGPFLASEWLCPLPQGTTGTRGVSTTNVDHRRVHIRRWTVGDTSAGPYREEDLPAFKRSTVSLTDLGSSNSGAAVEVFGGASITDSLTIVPGAGVASSRCSPQPANRWFFSSGSTLRGRDTYLLVENPFREEAVLQVRFLKPGGDFVPARLKDLLIPPLSQSAIYLSEYLEETETFGLDVTATRGRVVASRYIVVATRDGWKGISSDVGVREPSSTWFFGGGEVPQTGDSYIRMINTGQKEALIQVIFQTEDKQISPQDLQELAIPAGNQITVKASDYIGRGLHFGSSINSTNKVPIVAERETWGTLEGIRGFDVTFGVPALGDKWLIPLGSPQGGATSIAMTNFDRKTAVMRVRLIGKDGQTSPPELASIQIPPGLQRSVEVTAILSGATASGLVERISGLVGVEAHLFMGDPVNDFADASGQAVD